MHEAGKCDRVKPKSDSNESEEREDRHGEEAEQQRHAVSDFFAVCVFLSVCVFGLMRRLTGEPATKLLTDLLVMFLLVVLNTAVLVLHERNRNLRK